MKIIGLKCAVIGNNPVVRVVTDDRYKRVRPDRGL